MSRNTAKHYSNSQKSWISQEEYFSKYYQRISDVLRTFSQLRLNALRGADPSVRDRFLSAACEVLELSLEVTGFEKKGLQSRSLENFVELNVSLEQLLSNFDDHALTAGGTELKKHYAYLEERIPRDYLSTVIQASDSSAIIAIDFVTNVTNVAAKYIFNEYQWSSVDPRKVTKFFDISIAEAFVSPSARALMESARSKLEGWCSNEKAILLYFLVREYKPQTIVEIGIYGGRSIVPMASALCDNGKGRIYGIETWSGIEATSYRTSIGNDFWWMNVDFALLKGNFLDFIVRNQLQERVKVIEARSDRCAGLFDNIDMLHIDGGHSTFGAAQDVINFVPRLSPGSIVIYDDINWSTTGAGLEILRDCCSLLHVVASFDNPTVPGCAVFKKI